MGTFPTISVERKHNKLNVYKELWKSLSDGEWELSEHKLFSWDDIKGKDSDRFKDFIIRSFGIKWVEKTEIRKGKDDNTIETSDGINSLSLILDEKRSKVHLKLNDIKIDEFLVRKENGKLNIIEQGTLGCCMDHWQNIIKSKIEPLNKVGTLYRAKKQIEEISREINEDESTVKELAEVFDR